MKQYLLVLLVSLGLGGLVSSQMNIVAADQLPNFEATATSGDEVAPLDSTLLSEIAPVAEAEMADLSESPEMSQTYSYSYTYSTPVNTTPNFTVSVRNDSQILKTLSYSDIYRFKNLVYAHNSSNLFGVLSSYAPGTVFNITENGVTTSYRVAETRVFQKINDTTLYLCYNNNYADCHGSNQLTQIAKNTSYINESLTLSKYSLALMTCTGTPYGNGDASHRLVVFAYAL